MEALLERHIEITEGIRGGKPRISGTRFTVSDLVIMHRRLGQSLEEIAGRFELPLAGVYAAMAYYYDFQQAIDESIAQDEVFVESLRLNYPSLLQTKLGNERRG